MTAIAPALEWTCKQGGNWLVSLIGLLIFGAIIGVLARLALPGAQSISAVITVVLGVLGALIGFFLASLLNLACTGGLDVWRWIISIAVAALLVVGYGLATGNRQV